MDILNTYFSGLLFERTLKRQGFYLYVAAIKTMLADGNRRFIIAFVSEDIQSPDVSHLRDLKWTNLQIRELASISFDVRSQNWKPKMDNVPHIHFAVTRRDDDYSYYRSNNIEFQGMRLMMIHSSKKKTKFQYPNTMNLHYAIDQYSCSFGFETNQTSHSVTDDRMRNIELI